MFFKLLRFCFTDGPEYDKNGEQISSDMCPSDGLGHARLRYAESKDDCSPEKQLQIMERWRASKTWPKAILDAMQVRTNLQSAAWRDMCTAALGARAFYSAHKQLYMEDILLLAIYDKTPWLLFRSAAYTLWDTHAQFTCFGGIGAASTLSLFDFGVPKDR